MHALEKLTAELGPTKENDNQTHGLTAEELGTANNRSTGGASLFSGRTAGVASEDAVIKKEAAVQVDKGSRASGGHAARGSCGRARLEAQSSRGGAGGGRHHRRQRASFGNACARHQDQRPCRAGSHPTNSE